MPEDQPLDTPEKPVLPPARLRPRRSRYGWLVFAALIIGMGLYGLQMVMETMSVAPPLVTTVSVPPQPVFVPPPPPVPAVPPQQYSEAIGPHLEEVREGKLEEKGPPAPPPKPHKAYSDIGHVALVIDDCGISNPQTVPALDLPPEVTLTFLSWGHATPSLAPRAVAGGHNVLLHMPMQPKGTADPGPGAIIPGQTQEEIAARLEAGLAAVPLAIGVNNHMGSAATSSQPTMQAVMDDLKKHPDLFFLDSYTDAHSLAYKTALATGVKSARRDVFLDDDMDRTAVDAQLARLVTIAHRQGSAIAIGHPHPATLAALHDFLAKRGENGIELVRLKDLVEAQP